MGFSDSQHLRAAAPAATSQNPYGLNAREFDVARMLGRGLGLAEIAETLGLSGRSVLAQRERLMEKLRARNLAHLEHIIATLGQLDSDWSETVYLDDLSDGLTADADSDLIFAD
jgi:DNA-binding CsgD family transcriptional regulator